MDEPTKPGRQDTSKGPWPEESGTEDNFGATGIFGAVKSPQPTERLDARSRLELDTMGNQVAESPKPQSGMGAKALAEPVVHKVVLGGGAANPSASGRGTDGLDELIRSLGNEPRGPAVAPMQTQAPEPSRAAAPSSGFTSLLQKLGTPETSKVPTEDFRAPVQHAAALPIQEESKSTPVTSGTGGFTELFKAIPGGVSDVGQRPDARPTPPEQRSGPAPSGAGGFTELFKAIPAETPRVGGMEDRRPVEAPNARAGTPAAQAPIDNNAGTFTKLFGTFGGASAGRSVPASVPPKTEAPGSGGAGTFTQMFSVEQQSAAGLPTFREERGPTAGSLDFGHSPEKSGAAQNRDPFSQPLPAAQPADPAAPGSGVGITRLIRMLDGPSSAPAQRMESVTPAAPPPATGSGVWTQTFSTLGTPNESAVKSPEWPQPPLANSSSQSPVSTPPPPPAAAGPSEFTRILDASKIREMAMRGRQAAGAGSPSSAAPPQGTAPPPVAMPSYSAPAVPNMAGTPGMGGMQHLGGFPPPQPQQVPGYPMNFPHSDGAMPGGGLPQQPGMYVPTPQMPAAPPAPQLKPPEPAVGKLQQYVPLLLVMIIVLLVVILVTVVFLMKH